MILWVKVEILGDKDVSISSITWYAEAAESSMQLPAEKLSFSHEPTT